MGDAGRRGDSDTADADEVNFIDFAEIYNHTFIQCHPRKSGDP